MAEPRLHGFAGRDTKSLQCRLDLPTIQYFMAVAESTGIPYQTLINLYLRDCAAQRRQLSMEWRASA
ncbi:MAG TPA: antitoxin [Vicinamibacteria bacterium]|nr:antitoxin [Vicinamibacteria bacterium]